MWPLYYVRVRIYPPVFSRQAFALKKQYKHLNCPSVKDETYWASITGLYWDVKITCKNKKNHT